MTKPAQTTRRIVMLAFPNLQPLDLVGPLEVFDAARRACQYTRPNFDPYQIEIVAESREPLVSRSGLTILPTRSLKEVRGPIDTLVVVGGSGSRKAAASPGLVSWLKTRAKTARRVTSVCSGAFILGAAGLLDGRRATTHWARVKQLAEACPKATIEADPIFVHDGKIWTSAGVTAGMDLSLALVEADLGRDIALTVARQLVLFVRRPGGQSQFSAQLSAQLAEHAPLRALQSWLSEHLTEDLAVAALAKRVAMSPRHFARSFRAEIGTTPAAYVERLRLEVARRLLETTQLGIESVATQAGFGAVETLRRVFARELGITPKDYRRRFQPALGATQGKAA